jgi:hypothetical protein
MTDKSYFEMAAAGSDQHRVRHPMSDLANVERDLDEIEARANGEGEPVTVESLDAQAIWKNYRQNKGTPVSHHRLK